VFEHDTSVSVEHVKSLLQEGGEIKVKKYFWPYDRKVLPNLAPVTWDAITSLTVVQRIDANVINHFLQYYNKENSPMIYPVLGCRDDSILMFEVDKHYDIFRIAPLYDGEHYAVALIFPKLDKNKNYYVMFDPNEKSLGQNPIYQTNEGKEETKFYDMLIESHVIDSTYTFCNMSRSLLLNWPYQVVTEDGVTDDECGAHICWYVIQILHLHQNGKLDHFKKKTKNKPTTFPSPFDEFPTNYNIFLLTILRFLLKTHNIWMTWGPGIFPTLMNRTINVEHLTTLFTTCKTIVNQNLPMMKCKRYELIASSFATIHGETSFSDNVVDLFIEISRKYYDTVIINTFENKYCKHHPRYENIGKEKVVLMVFCIDGHFSMVLYVPATDNYPKRLVNFDPLHMGGELSREQLRLLLHNQHYLGLELFVKFGKNGNGQNRDKSDLFIMEHPERNTTEKWIKKIVDVIIPKHIIQDNELRNFSLCNNKVMSLRLGYLCV